jgi:excisionase family DNA binding protein
VSFLAALTAEARAELDALIDARIASALAARDREPDKRWLTAREAGTYLGTSRRAIYMRVKRKRIPPGAVRYIGRRLMVDRLALDRALERT